MIKLIQKNKNATLFRSSNEINNNIKKVEIKKIKLL